VRQPVRRALRTPTYPLSMLRLGKRRNKPCAQSRSPLSTLRWSGQQAFEHPNNRIAIFKPTASVAPISPACSAAPELTHNALPPLVRRTGRASSASPDQRDQVDVEGVSGAALPCPSTLESKYNQTEARLSAHKLTSRNIFATRSCTQNDVHFCRAG
jgi:hypothetical protein